MAARGLLIFIGIIDLIAAQDKDDQMHWHSPSADGCAFNDSSFSTD